MSEKSHLLLVDQQTFDHLLAGVRALQTFKSSMACEKLMLQAGEHGPMLDQQQLDTLAENLQTGFFKPDQGEVLRLYHQPDLMPFAERVGDYHSLDDEMEVDDEPIFSEADDGVWVSAWLWVPKPDED